ncbi:hypothetical protein LTR02_017095 [Friedmanniomyces endolithicus]|nr:hypothetical protein LTR02_017095 [Friedmanniomyces endolithicus]
MKTRTLLDLVIGRVSSRGLLVIADPSTWKMSSDLTPPSLPPGIIGVPPVVESVFRGPPPPSLPTPTSSSTQHADFLLSSGGPLHPELNATHTHEASPLIPPMSYQYFMKAEDIINIVFPTSGYGPIDIGLDIPGFESMTVKYGTDIPGLNSTVEGQKRYLYGPGSCLGAHGDHEMLTEAQLERAVVRYEKILWHALAQGSM